MCLFHLFISWWMPWLFLVLVMVNNTPVSMRVLVDDLLRFWCQFPWTSTIREMQSKTRKRHRPIPAGMACIRQRSKHRRKWRRGRDPCTLHTPSAGMKRMQPPRKTVHTSQKLTNRIANPTSGSLSLVYWMTSRQSHLLHLIRVSCTEKPQMLSTWPWCFCFFAWMTSHHPNRRARLTFLSGGWLFLTVSEHISVQTKTEDRFSQLLLFWGTQRLDLPSSPPQTNLVFHHISHKESFKEFHFSHFTVGKMGRQNLGLDQVALWVSVITSSSIWIDYWKCQGAVSWGIHICSVLF